MQSIIAEQAVGIFESSRLRQFQKTVPKVVVVVELLSEPKNLLELEGIYFWPEKSFCAALSFHKIQRKNGKKHPQHLRLHIRLCCKKQKALPYIILPVF